MAIDERGATGQRCPLRLHRLNQAVTDWDRKSRYTIYIYIIVAGDEATKLAKSFSDDLFARHQAKCKKSKS